ncbi:MAG: hypothetical protein KF799_16435 [Bdellovibrionales bacterium]|nr:hypothetical protein [Bdellovibrionales bacterium]
MFTEEQLLYIEEVLGASVDGFRVSAPAKEHTLAILTPPLPPEEQGLLAKILGSIQLEAYTHVYSLDEIPAQAAHVLSFQEASGRWTEGGRVWWGFPSLSSMLGPGAAVVAAKKEAWALLQQFRKEQV